MIYNRYLHLRLVNTRLFHYLHTNTETVNSPYKWHRKPDTTIVIPYYNQVKSRIARHKKTIKD